MNTFVGTFDIPAPLPTGSPDASNGVAATVIAYKKSDPTVNSSGKKCALGVCIGFDPVSYRNSINNL